MPFGQLSIRDSVSLKLSRDLVPVFKYPLLCSSLGFFCISFACIDPLLVSDFIVFDVLTS